jgi:hypothetical protein
MAIPTRAELDGLVREHLASDPTFRAALLADPRAAVSKLVGITLPDAVQVEVHEETLTHIHLVIAPTPSRGEIADEDLELVAGGGNCWDNCGCSI